MPAKVDPGPLPPWDYLDRAEDAAKRSQQGGGTERAWYAVYRDWLLQKCPEGLEYKPSFDFDAWIRAGAHATKEGARLMEPVAPVTGTHASIAAHLQWDAVVRGVAEETKYGRPDLERDDTGGGRWKVETFA